MRVLLFGSRSWRDREAIRGFIAELPRHAVVVHGAHWEGADKIAEEEALAAGLRVERHPARWSKEGPLAGPNRNSRMAASRPDFAVGFRMPGRSSGTDDMARKARKAGVDTYIVEKWTGGKGVEQVKREMNSWEQLTIET